MFGLVGVGLLLTASLHAAEPDLLIEKVAAQVARWLEDVPNFLCQQSTTRYFRGGPGQRWMPEGSTEAELSVSDGLEQYKLLSQDGEFLPRAMPVGFDDLGSRGEFMSAVRKLFDPASRATFRRRGTRLDEGLQLRRFDFSVRQENSQWYLGPDPGYAAAYAGNIWVDENDASLHRLRMEAVALPAQFVILGASIELELRPVSIGDKLYLMPSMADVQIRNDRGYWQRKVIRFERYRRFQAEAKVIP